MTALKSLSPWYKLFLAINVIAILFALFHVSLLGQPDLYRSYVLIYPLLALVLLQGSLLIAQLVLIVVALLRRDLRGSALGVVALVIGFIGLILTMFIDSPTLVYAT